jgi:3-oxoacyl-(acyl-carrier-protein) synthase
MPKAIEHAALHPDEIDAISAHGPSDPILDRCEARAIHGLFSEHRPAVTSIKGVTGNPLAAGALLQVAGGIKSLQEQCIPPTANFEEADDDFNLNLVTQSPRKGRIRNLLINSHGLGGANTSLVLKEIT